MLFKGSEAYVCTDDLTLAVNAAITLQRPLLVKGEPGTGKTMLAVEVAKALELPLLEWHIKSTTKLREALEVFFEVREVPGLKKKPSTSELLDWLKLLLAEDIPPVEQELQPVEQHGALQEKEQDVHLFERLIFMSRNA